MSKANIFLARRKGDNGGGPWHVQTLLIAASCNIRAGHEGELRLCCCVFVRVQVSLHVLFAEKENTTWARGVGRPSPPLEYILRTDLQKALKIRFIAARPLPVCRARHFQLKWCYHGPIKLTRVNLGFGILRARRWSKMMKLC